MNINEIRELAQIVSENSLTAIEIREGETRILIRRESPVQAAPTAALPYAQPGLAAPPAAPQAPEPAGSAVDFNRTFEVTSPLVGVFYASSAPGAEPFVKVGDRVKKGDVLCIVEAMKLMNEITAEREGEVVDVCVRDGDVVEFGQKLFKLC